MKEQQTKFLNICVWCAVVLFVLRCIISWKDILTGVSGYDLFGYAGEAIGVAMIFSGVYERWLWRINPLEKTPKLAKKYTGTFTSDHDHITREATLKINQTLLSVHVTFIADESTSQSISASIGELLGETKLTYCYLNNPKAAVRSRSPIHYGTASLSITETMTLEGQYYTDRGSTGDMAFKPCLE